MVHLPLSHFARAFAWLDSDAATNDRRFTSTGRPEVERDRLIPFIFLHAGCVLALFTGSSMTAIGTCVVLYLARMFAITGFYHRYFSHRSFKTCRLVQFVFAMLGCMSVQRGPLWWAAHHRRHHAASDEEGDVHSPVQRGFFWSHIGWITSTRNMATDYSRVKDFAQFPELRFVNRFDWLLPAALIVTLYVVGEYLCHHAPELKTNGLQLVAWGFFISTVILFHATCAINSVAHLFGYRRFDLADNSRNNPILALLTLGEGWHNNHHKYSHCVRQGLAWWELDITYYVLLIMEFLGLIRDLKQAPSLVTEERTDAQPREFPVKVGRR